MNNINQRKKIQFNTYLVHAETRSVTPVIVKAESPQKALQEVLSGGGEFGQVFYKRGAVKVICECGN